MRVPFHTVAYVGNLAGPDMLVLVGVALLIFGRRLPEIGQNLGRTIVEFKRGMNQSMRNEQSVEDRLLLVGMALLIFGVLFWGILREWRQ